jgi:hypothetical protein
MKNDEFAFFNQQLAAMLRDGIPLEGALRRLCQEMRRGSLRDELSGARSRPRQRRADGRRARAAPVAGTLQAHDSRRRQKRRPARRADDARGLFPAPKQPMDAAERPDGLSAHRFVRGIFDCRCFLSYILGISFGTILSSLVGGTFQNCDRFGLVCGCRRWFWPRAGRGFCGLSHFARRRMLRWRLPAFKRRAWRRSPPPSGLMLKNGVPLDDALTTGGTIGKRNTR